MFPITFIFYARSYDQVFKKGKCFSPTKEVCFFLILYSVSIKVIFDSVPVDIPISFSRWEFVKTKRRHVKNCVYSNKRKKYLFDFPIYNEDFEEYVNKKCPPAWKVISSLSPCCTFNRKLRQLGSFIFIKLSYLIHSYSMKCTGGKYPVFPS